MKKLTMILLCLALAGLCGCGRDISEDFYRSPTEPAARSPVTPESAADEEIYALLLGSSQIKIDESDPLSYAANSIVRDCYDKIERSKYALCDVNGDGVDEFFLAAPYDGGNDLDYTCYFLNNGTVDFYRLIYRTTLPLCVYKNGTIKVSRKEIKYTDGVNVGDRYTDYYTRVNQDGVAREEPTLLCDPGKYYTGVYDRPDFPVPTYTRVTKAKYEQEKNRLESGGERKINWTPLKQYARDLGSYNSAIDEHLKTLFDNHFSREYYFMHDIDGDGVDEFLWGKWENYGLEYIVLAGVFAVNGDSAIRQYGFREIHMETPDHAYLFKNGTIKLVNLDILPEEGEVGYYYRFDGGELKWYASLHAYNGRYSYYDANYNEKTIDKNTHARLLKEMEGDGEVVEINWKPISQYGQ